jgi:N-sulfoglucosamine sulfohydrolase
MSDKRPNVVVFITHDTGYHVSPYGYDAVHTPNAERLATEGVRMANSFCTSPLCSPSRACLFTGRFPHQNGVMGLTGDQVGGFDFFPGEQHASLIFSRAGYQSVLCGFEHESRHVAELGFGDLINGNGTWYNSGGDLLDHGKAIGDWLSQRDKHRPFYMQIGCGETHRAWLKNGVEPDDSQGVWMPPYLKDEPELRREMAEFQGSVRHLDAGLGHILDAFDDPEVKDNTIFVFTTDHGIDFPRAKGTMFDPGIGVFLFIRWPAGGLEAGRTCGELVSNVDLLPTLLEACGIPRRDNLAGRSYLPLLQNAPYEPNECVFAEKTYHDTYEPVRAIRTERYKYIRRFEVALMEDIRLATFTRAQWMHQPLRRNDEELYDLEADPWEMNNLAAESAYAGEVDAMQRRLIRWMRRTNDPLLRGPVPSPYYRHRLEQLMELET